MPDQGILSAVDLDQPSSIRRVIAGIEYYLHHVILTVNPTKVRDLTKVELEVAWRVFSTITTYRENPLLLHATLLFIEKKTADDSTVSRAAREYNSLSRATRNPRSAIKEYEEVDEAFKNEAAAKGITLPTIAQLKEHAPGVYNAQIFSSKRAGRIAEMAKEYGGDVRRIPAAVQLGLQPQPEGIPLTVNSGACRTCILQGRHCNRTERLCLYCRINWDVCQYDGPSTGELVGSRPANAQSGEAHSGGGSGSRGLNLRNGLAQSGAEDGNDSSSGFSSSPPSEDGSEFEGDSDRARSKHAPARQAGDTVIDDGSYDRSIAKVNIPDPSKLQIQIKVQSQDGQVRALTYTYPLQVDWTNKQSVEKLKKWRSQVFMRNLGGKTKAGHSWTDTEKVVLCNIIRAHLLDVGSRFSRINWNHVTLTFNSQMKGTLQHAGEALSERYNEKRKEARKSLLLKADREAPYRSSSALHSQMQRFADPEARKIVAEAKAEDDKAHLASLEDMRMAGEEDPSFKEERDSDDMENGVADDEYMDGEDENDEDI